MGKSKDDSTAQPVSEDSAALLAQAKKGKSYRFVMVTKGSAVLSLIVFKSGKPASRVPEAKKLAKEASGASGEACMGVVTGDGSTLAFKLLRSDGHNEGPVKPPALRTFLSPYLDCRPLFEILDALPLVLSDDNPLVARFLALNPAVVRLCDEQPNQAPQLNELCERIGRLLEDDQANDAAAALDELEKRLNASSSPSDGSQAEANSAQAQFQELLNSMKPLLDQAMAVSEGVRRAVGEATESARGGQYPPAIAQLSSLRDSLASVPAYVQAMAKVEPAYLATLQKQPTNAAKLRAIMGQIQANVEAGAFTAAVARIRDLIGEMKNSQGKETDVVAAGTVAQTTEQLMEAFRKSSLVWVQTRKTVEAELAKLEKAIISMASGEPDFATIQANSKNLYAILDALDERLSERLEEAATANDAETSGELQREALEIVDEYLAFCATNPFIQDVDDNGFVPLKVKSLLDTSLLALKRRLQQQLLGA